MTDEDIILKALDILKSRLKTPDFFAESSADVESYLKLKYFGQEHESFDVMFLTAQHGLIELKQMFNGTIDGAAVYPREVVKAALKFNAAAVVLAHNHPSGECTPSQSDKILTAKLVDALSLVDVRVLDHIVVG